MKIHDKNRVVVEGTSQLVILVAHQDIRLERRKGMAHDYNLVIGPPECQVKLRLSESDRVRVANVVLSPPVEAEEEATP